MGAHPEIRFVLIARRSWLAAALGACLLLSPASGQEGDPPRQFVERVEISTQARTRSDVVERYLSLTVGAPLHSEDLLTGRQRLSDTGFFKSVDVYARPGSAKGLVVVVVEIEEHRWPQYRFQGGHGEFDGWYLAPIGFVYDNFAGHGHRLDWESYTASHNDGDNLHYQHPYLHSGAAILDVDLFSQDRSFPHFINGRKTQETVSTRGFSLRFTGQHGRLQNLYSQLRLQSYRPEANARLDTLLHEDLQRARVLALGVGLQADTRDRPGFPTQGFWGRAIVEHALDAGAGNVTFTKITLDGRWYRALDGNNIVAVRAYGGLATDGAPFYQRFYLGGQYSLRGFEWAELTPVGWGTRTLQLQSELRFPFGKQESAGPRHTAVVYYDAGGIWRAGEIPLVTDLHHSVGLGYRRRLRVLGMLRLDLAFPVNGFDSDTSLLSLSLGHTF